MGKVKVVPATQELIDQLKGRLREADEREAWAMAQVSADIGMQLSYDRALLCWVALLDDVPFLVFGVSRKSLLSDTGTPWMLATDQITEASMAVLKLSKYYINTMLNIFERLEHYVDARNEISKNWLKWCGFTLCDPEPIGPGRYMFHKFYKNRSMKGAV